MVRFRQLQNLPLGNELFKRRHPALHLLRQLLWPAMLLRNRFQYARHRRAPSFLVIRRERLARVISAPKLARDRIHVPLDSCKFDGSIRHDLVRIHRGVQFQVQLLRELLLAQPPLAVRMRQQLTLKELLVLLQSSGHRFRRRF